jgi:hypothetical protein
VLARRGAGRDARGRTNRARPLADRRVPVLRAARGARAQPRTVFLGGMRPDEPAKDPFIHLGNPRREWNIGRAAA